MNKEFLIIGSLNAVTYKEILPLIKDNKMWLGVKNPTRFLEPDNNLKKFGNIFWYTNLIHNHRNKKIELIKKYDEESYPKYDNYNAIEVSKTINIPYDYFGIMGVPVSFLNKHNPEQFEILGLDRYTAPKEVLVSGRLAINGIRKYRRILIRRKDDE